MAGTGKISTEALEGLAELSQKVELGILAIADRPPWYPIVFASHTEPFIGWGPSDFVGRARSLARLLPVSVRERHGALMEGFKGRGGAGNSQAMAGGRAVEAVHKNTQTVRIRVAVSYHPPVAEGDYGLFLALIQDPEDTQVDDRQLADLRLGFNEFIYASKQAARAVYWHVAKQVAIKGGPVAAVMALITQITPLGTALKSSAETFGWAFQNPGNDAIVVARVDQKSRLQAMKDLRDALREEDERIVAVGYYLITGEPGNQQIQYGGDSGTVKGEEVWFFDKTERKLILSPLDREKLIQRMDCILKIDGAAIGGPNGKRLNLILCPTLSVVPSVNGRVRSLRVTGVSAIATTDTSGTLEPMATILFRASPAIETLEDNR